MKKAKEEIIKEDFIDEKNYQQMKKKICKKDDYYTIKEWKKLIKQLK